MGVVPVARASTNLTVVAHYSDAAGPNTWKTGGGLVPDRLLGTVTVVDPSRANQAPYPNVFLQNELFVVCYDECEKPQPSFADASTKDARERALKISTVYYWVNRLMESMATVGFRPEHRLIVRVDRNVESPTTGIAMDNNAFFNEKDWSLSFLPVGGLLSQVVTGFLFSSPAVDPSVAMHETMHSVFQQVIGPILNPEVYGLHEAFADYFALDLLNDHRLGMVFASGKILRENDQVLKYREGLEVHRLGNVVSSALWKIRGVVGDPAVARRVAFATIRKLGADPYVSAGDVARLHQAAAKEACLGDGLLGQIASVWSETGLEPLAAATEPAIPADLIPGGAFSLVLVTRTSPELAKQWGFPATKVDRVGTTASKGDDTLEWQAIAVGEGDQAERLTVLAVPKKKSVLAVYGEDRRLVSPSGPGREVLRDLSTDLAEIQKWRTGEYDELAELLNGTGDLAKLRKADDIRTEKITLRLNGRDTDVLRITYRVKENFLARFGSSFMGADYLKGVRSIDSVALDTVSSAEFPRLRTIEVRPGRRLVGVTVRNTTGLVTSSNLTQVDLDHEVLQARKLAK